ncbi:uncharacterized protein C2orf81 homolog [Mugil cephalus]|uniref:uncharacterized protein C2orf81 homolog n=1 Tax=Mugil cephalus TaxID=48193 RepID=UPI001FB7FE0E|nr:uncharacterized protein C2orf81 homolog [Mugil cephalus]
MPRTAAKSKTVHKTPPPVQEEEVEYISPDLTEDQWPDILETHEVVGEIMEDLMGNVMKGCLKVDIDRQLIRYTTSWVKSFIIQTLERQIFYPDEGPEDLSKTEDSEPTPAAPDAWAQGCVPVVKASPRPHSTSQKLSEADMVPVQTELSVNDLCNGETQTKSSPEQPKKETSPTNPASGKHYKVLSPCPPPPKTDVKRKQQVNLLPKPIAGKVLPPLPYPTDTKDVGVDRKMIRQKNCHLIPKLDPLCLPQHCTFPQYEIVDSNCPKPNSKKKLSVLPRLQPRNNSQHTDCTVTSPKPLTSSKEHLRRFRGSYVDDDCVKKVYHSRQTRRLSSPDTMRFSKDVFLDVQTVEMNPLILGNPSQSAKLTPIRSNPAVPLYSVNQVTTGPPPKVTPLFLSKSHDL